MTRYVALIRGINVGATRKLPMAELRAACTGAGFDDVSTYIQSGNALLTSDAAAPDVADRLRALILDRFALDVPVIVSTAAQWRHYAAGSPFPDAEAVRPKMLHLCLSAKPCRAEAVDALAARAQPNERVAIKDGALWVDFGDGVGSTKLTPGLFDKSAGSPVTARNWNTVLALAALLGEDGA